MKKLKIYLIVVIIFSSNFLFASNFKIIKTPPTDSIYSLENIIPGALSQKILITGKDTSKPILLFGHGGPGFTENGYANEI